MRKLSSLLLITAGSVLLLAGCGVSTEGPPAAVTIESTSLKLFRPLPTSIPSTDNPITDEKVALGRMLYYEERLSKSQTISCNSCHDLNTYGVDGHPTSDGHKGLKGDRNSPTVYNAAGHFVQFWDGRAADVEAQAKGPVMNPVEMAMPSEKEVIAVLKSMPEYVEAFQKAFPREDDPISFDNMALAIGAFERNLVTPSRWDEFLGGDQEVLTATEKAGFNVYMDTGCQACHAGTYMGGDLYQRLGAVKPWPDTSDTGREKVTGNESDRLVFKVPSLRNIRETGPYYHNGKVESLEEAIARMGEYQLGKTLSLEEVQSIASFLGALTGEIPAEYIRKPPLPASTADTPEPEAG